MRESECTTQCSTTTTLSEATCTDRMRMKCDIDSHTNSASKPLIFSSSSSSSSSTSPESSSLDLSYSHCFHARASDGLPTLEPLKIGLESDDEDDSSIDSSCSDDDIDIPHPCIQSNSHSHCIEQQQQRSRGSSLVNNLEYFHKKSQAQAQAQGSSHLGASEENVVSSISTSACTSSLPPASSISTSNVDQPLHDNSTNSLPSLVGSDSLPNKRPRLNGYNGNLNRPTPRPRKKKGVTIHKSVAVVPIPSRLEYSSRMRERLWTSSSDLASNAARNTIEFASEGWNWRNVIEDENMLVHQANGELIHPIHIHNALYCASQASSGEDIKLNLSLLACIVPNSSAASRSRPLLLKPNPNQPALALTMTALPKQVDAKKSANESSNANPSHAVA
uniref:Uncharacterized protein n=1 Tax=Chaetoceros debilis TaxID=122233 RepID=A0A7S3Q3Z4_9STRA